MSLSYNKIKKKPTTFNSLFGLSVSQFEEILIKAEPEWNKKVLGRYRRPGRPYDHPLEDMILILLLYYRCYITQEFLGYLFNLDKSRICRIIQTLEPVLATVVAISKRKHLSKKEVENLIIDATEQPVERPGKGQNLIIPEKRNATRSRRKCALISKVELSMFPNPGQVPFMILPFIRENLAFLPIRGYLLTQAIKGWTSFMARLNFPIKLAKTSRWIKRKKNTTGRFHAFASKSRI